ncbi:MAG: type II toxin-antitoxin system RelB/DinJ family antitoxin [Oscillospiraceae bacterium]|nr:type II toxin-antitoxin system RelB/DinJ family antitoxin [Oscillospiraceae bacterium]
MSSTNISINIDSELNEKAQSIFNALGIDVSTAINMLLRKAIYQEDMSLDVISKYSATHEKKNRKEAFGCLKGKIRVPDNFNEPLDDFKEYM